MSLNVRSRVGISCVNEKETARATCLFGSSIFDSQIGCLAFSL